MSGGMTQQKDGRSAGGNHLEEQEAPDAAAGGKNFTSIQLGFVVN